MKLTRKQEKEIFQVYDAWLHSYLNGDVATYDSYFDDAYHFIGSTDNEEFLNRKETTEFFRNTADQLSGKTELRNQKRVIEQFGQLVIITHVFDAWFFDSGEWSYYGRFRFSSALEEKKAGWRFIYQHFSTTDPKAGEGQTIGYDKISEENLQLREAIKRRTRELEEKNRELEIESALERIRAQATAMKTSAELLDIVVTMRNEFTKLGHRADYFWHMTWLPDKFEKAMTSGDGSRIGTVMELPRDFHSHYRGMDEWENSEEPIMVLALEVDIAVDYIDRMIRLGNFQQVDPNAPTLDDIRHIKGITFVMARTSHGEIGYSLPGVVKEPPTEDLEILARFAGAFDLAHRRFLDLKKAEKQAKDVQVDLALEKVRSRTMAMRNADELADTAMLLFAQVTELGIKPRCCGFLIMDEENRVMEDWSANLDELGASSIVTGKLAYDQHPILEQVVETWRKARPYFIGSIHGKELQKYYKAVTRKESITEAINDEVLSKIESEYTNSFYFEYGMMYVLTPDPISNYQISVLIRFANVFKLTYRRFLDIKKAEEQAREAQVEAALERVRARSMAMHNSEELKEVIQVVYDQMVQLGMHIEHTGFIVDYKTNDDMHIWLADKNEIPSQVTIPYFDCAHWNSFREAKEKGSDFFANKLDFEEKNRFYKDLFQLIPGVSEEVSDYYFRAPGLAISTVLLDNVGLYIENFSGESYSEEDNDTLMRFAKVFEQTYTRFLDLKKVEAQAREAQVEAALERVRAKTMAMHNSEDVEDTVVAFFEEVMRLGIDKTIRCGIGILEGQEKMETWSANMDEGGKVKMFVGMLDMAVHPMLIGLKKAWQDGSKGYAYHFDQEDVVRYYTALNNEPEYPFQVDLDKLPKGQNIQTFFFSSGIIFAFTENRLAEDSFQILDRFAEVFGQTYRRYLDLRKAEAQAREAQIEAALERVRSRSMAMHKTSELQEVINTVHKELLRLEVEITGGAFLSINEEIDKELYCWGAGGTSDYVQRVHLPFFDRPIYTKIIEGIKKGPGLFTETYSQQEKLEFFNFLFRYPPYVNSSEDHKKEVFSRQGGYTRSCCVSKHTSIFVINHHGREFTFAENEILKRFGRVFEQAYTRFLDIRKAEAQSREAQIELALERVRNRAMTMMQSDELAEVIITVFKELQGLDMQLTRCLLWIFNKEDRSAAVWMTNSEDPDHADSYHVPDHDHPAYKNYLKSWEDQKQDWEYDLKGKIKDRWDDMLVEGFFKSLSREVKDAMKAPKRVILSGSFNKYGLIQTAGLEPLSKENRRILRRFSQVFEQNYNRFLDLQKAEWQAREARIEAALEKVRSRSLAMHKSEELSDTSVVVFAQLLELGIAPNRLFIGIFRDDGETMEAWATNEDGTKIQSQFNFNVNDNKSLKKMHDGWQKKRKSIVIDMKGKELKEYFRYLREELNVPFQKGLSESRRVQTIAYFSQGLIGMASSEEQPEETTLLLERFAAVFNLTYARFNDLQVAEAQTKKANLEVALERVRARALAMQEPEELIEVARVMRHEMGLLGMEALETSSIYINNEDNERAECWYALKDVRKKKKKLVSDHFQLSYSDTWVGRQMLDFYNGEAERISIPMKGAHRKEWIDYCSELTNKFKGYYGKEIPDRTYHLYKFSNGSVAAATSGEISEESWELLRRTAGVFSLAYSRFKDLTKAREDLQRLKAEKKRAEEALKELKATQSQLIQSEKMASLGELTAGIAHEIQNPLNFVNNFAEVSQELVEEMREELEKGELEEVREISSDLEQNLQKISHHGNRASDIVKGMLQHSRSSSSSPELTDINKLADEYLRLAYHGLRAKDKSFNAEMKTSFEEGLQKTSVIPQEIGRVILNLITNAFHAVSERKKVAKEDYRPVVTIGTRKRSNNIEIKVADNGAGIPKEVLNKIFQPFFTTKPTGQGTGLGLSLSYDIIKAHGGEIKVKTKSNKGTEFTIQLPI